jgi:hypothetical protein
MVFLDESSKDGHTIFHKYGQSPWGKRPVIHESLDQGTWYTILPVITVNSYVAARVIEGSVDGAEFFDFVLNDLVSTNGLRFVASLTPFQLPQMEEQGLKVVVMDN